MLSTLLTATLLSAAFSIKGALAQFNIFTIDLNQCGSAHITWTGDGAKSPYNLAVVPADDPCNTILVDLGDHDGLSMTWHNVTVPSGTKVMFSLLDSTDQEAWSGAMTVGDGDNSCLPDTSSAVPSSTDASSDVGGVTTLILTSSFPSRPLSSATESATIVGAANAGTLGNASGAMSNVRLPVAATVLASVAAIAAALTL